MTAKLESPRFFDKFTPDILLSVLDWRAKDDYALIIQKIKNSRRNQSIDKMMTYVHDTFVRDLNNRCLVSQLKAKESPEFIKLVEEKNSILCEDPYIDLYDMTESQCKKIGLKTLMNMCDELTEYTKKNLLLSDEFFSLESLIMFYSVYIQKLSFMVYGELP